MQVLMKECSLKNTIHAATEKKDNIIQCSYNEIL